MSNRIIPFSTAQEVNKLSGDRNITLFARGDTSAKTARLVTGKEITAIVDNASNLWGKEELGLTIQNPEEYLNSEEGKNSFIIICTTSFEAVSIQLAEMGFVAQRDFVVSPVLNNLRIITELESIKKRFLFTSGAPIEDSLEYGGGVYEMTVDGDEWEYKKVISGYCYGLIAYGENFISVDSELGIFEFDKQYNIIRNGKLPPGTRAHGVSYSEITKCFYVVGSYLDAVLVLNEQFEVLDKIRVSEKIDRNGLPHHHCNDCFVLDHSLYVSMFSKTGNWKKEVYDGVVLEYDIITKEYVGEVMKDLWMPHNISYWDGSLTVLDSLPGFLRRNNGQAVGQFTAFTRGLAYDGVYYYIGQSRNRNFSKNLGVSKNIAIDAGVIIFDETTKVSRFLQVRPKVSEIHAIHLLD